MQPSRHFSTQGFAVSVGWSAGLAIDDTLGCELKVLSGQAWITVAGSPDDVIVNPSGSLQLRRGVRYNVSALYDKATVLIEYPRHVADVDFSLNRRGAASVLRVTAASATLSASLARIGVAVASMARRWFAAPAAST